MPHIEPLRWVLPGGLRCKHAGERASSIRTKSWTRHERRDSALDVAASRFPVRIQEGLSSGSRERNDRVRYHPVEAACSGALLQVRTGPYRLDLLVSDIFHPQSEEVVALVGKLREVFRDLQLVRTQEVDRLLAMSVPVKMLGELFHDLEDNDALWQRVKAWADETCVDARGRPMHELERYQIMQRMYRQLARAKTDSEINDALSRNNLAGARRA